MLAYTLHYARFLRLLLGKMRWDRYLYIDLLEREVLARR